MVSAFQGLLPAIIASWRRAGRRPLRTLLTVLEVALGALAVTVALNLVQGRQASTAAPDVFRAVSGARDPNSGNVTTYGLFNRDDLAKVLKVVPDVLALEIERSGGNTLLEFSGERFKVVASSVTGTEYPKINPINFVAGSFFVSADLKGGSKPILISSAVAMAIFDTEKVAGKEITVIQNNYDGTQLSRETHRIVGVYANPPPRSSGFPQAQLILPPGGQSMYGSSFDTILARAKPGRVGVAREQLKLALLKQYAGRANLGTNKAAIFTTTSDNSFEVGDSGPDPQTILFTGFAIVMLIACSIGIFSIQLVDIAERTREIGMRRALGATRGRIVAEILLDALLLSGLGALLGVLIALPALPMIASATGRLLFSSGLTYSPVVALQVVGLVLVVGGLLALYPALIASRLRPVEALREA